MAKHTENTAAAPAAAPIDTAAADREYNAAWAAVEDGIHDLVCDPQTAAAQLAGIMLRSIAKVAKVKGAKFDLLAELANKNAHDIIGNAADLAAHVAADIQIVMDRPAEKRIIGDTLVRPLTLLQAAYNLNPNKSDLDSSNVNAVMAARTARLKAAAAQK